MKKTVIAVAAMLLGQASPAFSQATPFVDNFNDGVLSESRYKIRTNTDNSTVIVDNGLLRLEAVSDGTRSARAALDLVEQTDFIQADIKLDSTSMAEGAGMARVMISGVLYNDTSPFGVEGEGSIGDVLVQLSLRLKGDGSLSSLICAFRSNDEDFRDISTIVIDGFTECGRFETDIQFGVPYTASIYIDQENRKLVFKLDGSTIEHVIRGNIFEPSPRAVSSVLALSNGIGNSVAFADNLSNSFESVPTDEAPTNETPVEAPVDETPADAPADETPADAPADETPADAPADETPADAPADDAPADTPVADVPANDTNDEIIRNSVGGCSIGGASSSNNPMFLMLLTLALLVPGLRRLLPASRTMKQSTAEV